MANTLTGDKLVYASFPIIKSEEDPEGNLIVYGKATDGSVDSDYQIVDPEWSAKALEKWMNTGANVRVQHNPKLYPAGKGVELETTPDGHFVKALIVEETAKKLVKHGILQAYSVGIAHPVIERDMTGKARGGIIKGNENTEIYEISLVDRPANRSCGISLMKSAVSPEAVEGAWQYGDLDDLLLKAEKADRELDERIDQYMDEKRAWKAAEPSIGKASTGTDYLVARSSWQKWNDEGEELGFDVDGRDGYFKWLQKRDFDRGVGGGVDRDKLPANAFADPENRKYPIVTPKDVSDAAGLVGHASNPDRVKQNIIRIANRKGPEFAAKLPDSWTKKGADVEKGMKCPECGNMNDAGAKKCDCGASMKSVKADYLLEQVAKGLMSIDEAREELAKAMKPKKKPFPGAAEPMDGKDSDGDGQDADEPTDKGASLMEGSAQNAGPLEGKPSFGEKGPGGDAMKPAYEHREPDGTTTVEPLEHDAGMSTTKDPVPDKVPSSVKTISYSHQRMHDALCAAYSEVSVKSVYPSLNTFADAIDPNFWRDAAAEADRAGKAKKTARLRSLAQQAEAVKSMDTGLLSDARADLFKMFMDSYPNVHLTPSSPPQPGQFKRPFISGGHADLKPSGKPRIPSGTHVPEPGDFGRGPLTTGHERPSPANKGNLNTSVATGSVRSYYPDASRAATLNAIQAMHDHICRTYPDTCALAPSDKVLPNDMAASAVPQPVQPARQGTAPGEKSVDPDLVKSIVAQEISSLRDQYEETISKYEKKISKMQKEIDELGSQPDPAQAPVRGAVRKAAAPVAPVEKAATAPGDDEERAYYAYLVKAANSGIPEYREKAQAVLEELSLKKLLNS